MKKSPLPNKNLVRLISEGGGDGVTGDTRSVRVEEELEAGGNGCSAESALVDQMEELKGDPRDSRTGEAGGGEQVPAVAERFRNGSAFIVWREIC
ncbi:hypothetical protein F7725_027305 [Dissostichus mawsoni]|uniref:Uncharacterized protein n=1 Tax=Dissostichus mawsoni TaxID=36200 RepID=A0A7J5XDT0_DISMA|nr:hypothetical protein F7725_027305 [Dissostichus mawsoni]